MFNHILKIFNPSSQQFQNIHIGDFKLNYIQANIFKRTTEDNVKKGIERETAIYLSFYETIKDNIEIKKQINMEYLKKNPNHLNELRKIYNDINTDSQKISKLAVTDPKSSKIRVLNQQKILREDCIRHLYANAIENYFKCKDIDYECIYEEVTDILEEKKTKMNYIELKKLQ